MSNLTVRYFDYKLFNGKLADIFSEGFNLSRPRVIDTINPHSFVVAAKDPVFRKSLKNSDHLLVDGFGVKIFMRMFFGKRIPLISGPNLHDYIVDTFRESKLTMAYLGSSDDTLSLIKAKLTELAPAWTVHVYSPPYKEDFSDEDNRAMCNFIQTIQPDILFVGMTAPKQEKWIFQNYANLTASYVIAIGAVFDFFAGKKKMGPPIMIKLNLIWLYRLVTDFRRVWRRTFVSVPKFVFYHFFPGRY